MPLLICRSCPPPPPDRRLTYPPPPTTQLGYTTAAVHLHTDMPFMDVVPGFQVLHCIRTADTGGENYVADAVAAANYLRRTDRHSFDILSNVPVHLSRHQAKFVAETRYPMLQLNDDGEVVQVSERALGSVGPHPPPAVFVFVCL